MHQCTPKYECHEIRSKEKWKSLTEISDSIRQTEPVDVSRYLLSWKTNDRFHVPASPERRSVCIMQSWALLPV